MDLGEGGKGRKWGKWAQEGKRKGRAWWALSEGVECNLECTELIGAEYTVIGWEGEEREEKRRLFECKNLNFKAAQVADVPPVDKTLLTCPREESEEVFSSLSLSWDNSLFFHSFRFSPFLSEYRHSQTCSIHSTPKLMTNSEAAPLYPSTLAPDRYYQGESPLPYSSLIIHSPSIRAE